MRYLMLALVWVAFIYGEDSLQHATVSAYAVDMETGEVLVNENSDKSLIPGSCIKVVTTAAALHLLGSQAQFETQLEYDGNLTIRGGGDPCLGSNRISSVLPWKKQIEAWANAFEKLGIRTIEGDVIGDATLWEKASAPPSWAFEDLGNYYGAGASALSFHENLYALFFKPGTKVGESAAILRTEPVIPALVLQNEVKTGAVGSGDGACIYGIEFSLQQTVRGTVPAGVQEFSIKGSIPDPAAFCAQLLSQELQRRGIKILKKPPNPAKKIIVHTTTSPPLSEIIYWTNQKSINLYAEHLLKKMGEKAQQEGSTSAGIQAVREFLKKEQVDLDGFNMVDGSGLSRKNLMTTKQLVAVLLKMKKSEHFPVFFESLPSRDSKVRAKSGSMSLIRGCCGYAGNVAFAILINQCTDSQAMKAKIDSFLAQLSP